MPLSLFVLTSVRLRFKWFVQPKLYHEISFSHAFMPSSPVKRLVACKRLVQHGFGFDLAGRQRWLRVRWQSFPDWPCTFKHCALDMFSSQPHHCHVCFCFLLLFLFKSMQLTGLFEEGADLKHKIVHFGLEQLWEGQWQRLSRAIIFCLFEENPELKILCFSQAWCFD